jgi:superfamily II DNA/RNA helicase
MPALDAPTTYVAPAEPLGFAELGVDAALVAVLTGQGILTAFPIQAATLPDSLAGRDVLGRGRTGSGKTIAFALPIVTALAASGRRRAPNAPRALVLVPTRELANQVAETMAPLAQALSLRTTTIFGGVSQSRQVSALKAGVDIVIACPGRLEDLIGQGLCRLDAIEVTVLDEADHMADLGFLPGVKRLLDRTPQGTQRLLFSATLDRGVDVVVRRYLSNPVAHSVDPPESAVSTMEHHVFAVTNGNKPEVVRELVSGRGRTLAFTRTKHQAKKLAKQLTAQGIPSVDLHGNLSQNARERNLEAFSDGTVRVLVATDIAARGIHVDDVNLVVHIDPPTEHKAYLHRSGRTARAGADGIVVTVATPDQAGDVRTLMRQAGISPTVRQVSPGHVAIVEITGPPAPHVQPVPEPVRPAQSGRIRSGNGRKPVGKTAAGGTRSPGRSAGSSRTSGRPSGAGRSSERSSGPSSIAAFSERGTRRGR